jgi:hypothetical protein
MSHRRFSAILSAFTLVLITGGFATSAQAQSVCSPVVYTSSNAQATYEFDPNWLVLNDAWNGGHGPQTINVCTRTSWYAVSNQKNIMGEVETYPNTEYVVSGIGGGWSGSKKTISQYNKIMSTYNESFPTDSSMDAAYDLWLNNWGTEIMVWNEVHGSNAYWLTQGISIKVAKVAYQFINFGDEFVFIRKAQNKAGSVNLLAAMRYLVNHGLVKGSDVPTQLEYGVEISSTNGPETFPLNNVTFSLA